LAIGFYLCAHGDSESQQRLLAFFNRHLPRGWWKRKEIFYGQGRRFGAICHYIVRHHSKSGRRILPDILTIFELLRQYMKFPRR
jgi:hypothetical protein